MTGAVRENFIFEKIYKTVCWSGLVHVSISWQCTVFNKFGSTAINCPRSLQILYCQRMLFCSLQRIYSSVAIFSDYLIRKSLQFWRGLGCSMQTSNFRLCKKICCDCKTLIAQFKLQNYHQKTATILGSAQLFSNNYKVHSRIQLHWKSLCRRKRQYWTVYRYIFLCWYLQEK
jgi:hypothetical protein